MSGPIVAETARERLRSPVAIAFLIAPPVFAVVSVAVSVFLAGDPLSKAFGNLGDLAIAWCGLGAALGAFFLGAGILGGPLQSGEAIAWVTRPIRLADLYLSRLLGAWVAVAAVTLLPWLLALPFAGAGHPDADIVVAPVTGLLLAASILAVIGFLSTFLPGHSDAALYLLGLIGLTIGKSALEGSWRHATAWLSGFVLPPLAFVDSLVRTATCRAAEPLLYLTSLTFFLAAGIVVFSRREFRHGQGV